VTELRDTEQTV